MSKDGRPRPVEEAEVEARRFEPDGPIPNHPTLPALLYRDALGGESPPERVEALFRENGWAGTWTWEVFDYHHYHTRSHEALAVASGAARLLIGGPSGWTVEARAGDVLILPVGTGHRQLEKDGRFRICGAYPPGQESPDIVREPPDDAALERIRAVPPPESDPVWGGSGPLLERWRMARGA